MHKKYTYLFVIALIFHFFTQCMRDLISVRDLKLFKFKMNSNHTIYTHTLETEADFRWGYNRSQILTGKI